MNYKNFTDQISVVEMDYSFFNNLPECPVQRNHKDRAKNKKTREKLANLQPQHIIVASAILTSNSYDPTNGITYIEGTEFLVDGHTRREFWKQGYSDFAPEKLTVMRFKVDSIGELRDLYYTFDNSSNTEKSTDLAYGACRYLDIDFKNHKMYNVTGLTWAGHFYDRKTFPKSSGYDGNGLIVLYQQFTEEVLFLDSFAWDKNLNIPQPLKTAALLFLKKHMDEGAKDIVKRIFTDDFQGKDENGKLDAVTHLLCWLKDKNSDFTANFNTIPVLSEKILYWMNQAYLEKKQGKERLSKKGDHSGILEMYEKNAQFVNSPLTKLFA